MQEGPPVARGRSVEGRPVTPSLRSFFQVEVENFVLRVAAEFSSRKEQLVFLINNYDMMLGVLMVPEAPSPVALPQDLGSPLCPLSSTSAEIMLALSSVFFLESDMVSGSIW